MPLIIFGLSGMAIAGLSLVKDIVTDNDVDEASGALASNAVALIIAGTAAWLLLSKRVKIK